VGVVGADVDGILSPEFPISDPDVGLNVFYEVADMNRAVSIRQRAGDEDLSHLN